MSRLLVLLVVLLAIVAGVLFFLSTLAREKSLTRIEQPVANEALAQ